MKYSTFETLTVGQYQQLCSVRVQEGTDMDKLVTYVSILTGLSENQVEEMSLADFNKSAAELTKIFSKEIKGKPKPYIRIGGKCYGIIYKPSTLSAGQYIEIQTWSRNNLIDNMHLIMASLVYEVKGWGPVKWRGKYDAARHPIISEQIRDCNFIDVHSTCVFFLNLWRNSIIGLKGYLSKEMLKKGVSNQMTEIILKHASDGFLTPNELQILKT